MEQQKQEIAFVPDKRSEIAEQKTPLDFCETIKFRRKMCYVCRKDRKTFGMLIEMDKRAIFFDEIDSIDHKHAI